MGRDLVIAILGIALSITLFLAQGPYDNLWQYLLGLSPLLITGGLIGILRLWTKIRELRAVLSRALGTRAELSLVMRVNNVAGDVTFERRYRLEVVTDDVEVRETKEELLFARAITDTIPPAARVSSSSRPGTTLSVKFSYHTPTVVGGENFVKYGWSYQITPPLQSKGDFVEYRHDVTVPRLEPEAFTPGGALLFFEHANQGTAVEMTLLGPAGHCFEILSAWREDFDGRKIALDTREYPTMSSDKRILTWRPLWLRGARHVCNYRLVAV